MKYNIIGDIHGRDCWKKLVREDCVNVFVGDYFCPYDNTSFDKQRDNFLEIINYKIQHPETVLLIGNHDEDHWHIMEEYSRHDYKHVMDIYNLFEQNKNLFQVAFSTNDDKVLITHAGVSLVWYARYKYNKSYNTISELGDESTIEEAYKKWSEDHRMVLENKYKFESIFIYKGLYYVFNDKFEIIYDSPKEIADFINKLWLSKKYRAFNFKDNCNVSDCYGDSIQQSPMWIRPEALAEGNIFNNRFIAQVVGHTQFEHPSALSTDIIREFNELHIKANPLLIFVDCLGYNANSIIYEDNEEDFIINKKN